MGWEAEEGGATIGSVGSEDGKIIRDDGLDGVVRVTIERDGTTAPFSITCGIYGWMFHTRFFGTEQESLTEFDEMKAEMAVIVGLIPSEDDPADEKTRQATDRILEFVDRFP